MSTQPAIAVVGLGGRGQSLVDEIRRVADREYLFAGGSPDAYHEHAVEVPDWAESIDDLCPSITTLYDPDPDAREQARNTCHDAGWNPDVHGDLDAFLASDAYDTVVVSSPNDVHTESVLPLLEQGIDLFLEKPLGATLPQHDRIIEAADRSDSRIFMAFNLRSSPFFARLKERVADGEIGDLGMISCQAVRLPFGDGYRYTQARSGGTLLEKNCHDFDVFCWLAESDPSRVAAFGGQHVFTEDSDTLDHATVLVEFENGVRATLELCLYAPYGQRNRRYELRGTEGLLRSSDPEQSIDQYDYWGRSRHELDTDRQIGGHHGADYRQMHRFLRFLRGEADAPATLIEAKRASAIAIAAQRSIEDGNVVEIDENYDLLE